ncbi:MAG TPA: serine hydrolase domain-containing protein [Cyclobacteriaceae bacterium]
MKLLTTLFLLICCLFSCTNPEKMDGFTSSLDSLFMKSFPTDEPGGAILIMKGDHIIFSRGYGIANLSTQAKINSQTLFNLGSISKTFVANAILILQSQSKLSIEDSMEKYFPDFKDKQIAKKVKIKHLLTHTSGLPDIRQTRLDSVFYLTAKDAENWYPVTQTDSLVFEPGTRYEYSNPAFNGLALIVEKVSRMKWQQFVKQNIFDPAGMKTSTITDGSHPESGVAHAYLKRNGKWIEKDYGEEPTFAAAGNGGVWSSVEELAKYEQSLRGAIFLNEAEIVRSRTITDWPNWNDVVPPSIGWSWFIGQTNDGLQTVGHTGSQGGFLCNYVTIPDKKILFLILCNTPRDVEDFTEFISSQLIKYNWLEPANN